MIDNIIKFSSLNITLEDVYEAMGYKGNIPEQEIVARVTELLIQASKKIKPLYNFKQTGGKFIGDAIEIENVIFGIGSIIAKSLRHSTQFAFFVATSGEEFEIWYREIKSQNDWVDIFIVDSIGTCIAEKAGDYLEFQLEKEIGNLKHTNRFSPGYCGWNLIEQRKLFSLLPSGVCGISINDSCLMHPIKSISGIIGIGKNVKVKVYSCQICNKIDCFRRKPMNQIKYNSNLTKQKDP
jgi:hypothetical protein